MALYTVLYTYHEDEATVATRDRITSEHVAFINKLQDSNVLLAAGLWGPDEPQGGQFLIKAESSTAVRDLIMTDPNVQAGCTSDVTIREWRAAVGTLLPALTELTGG